MKKGLLLVASSLLFGALVSCGGTTQPEPEKPVDPTPTPEATALTTVKATYNADYRLDVTTEKPGEKAFERQVKDTVTVEADFTAGNLYLHAKRVGTELETVDPTTYEVLVYKNGDTYEFLNTQMGAAVTLKDEAAAKEKIDEYLRKASFRSGGWIDASTFTFSDVENEYIHHHFLLDSTTIPLEDFDDEAVITETETGKKIAMDMTYVGYQTDAGTSELHNDPIAASVEVTTDKGSRVTGFNLDYKGAWMDMPIGTPAPVLTLKGNRNFTAEHDVEIERLATIDHSAVKGTMVIKDSYGNGKVEVFASENGKLEPRTKLKNGDQVEVDTWLTVEATPNEGGSVKSVLLNTNAQSLVEDKYVFAAVAPTNEIKVVFTGGVAQQGTIKFAEGVNPSDLFTKWNLATFEFVGGGAKDIKDITGNKIDLQGSTWGAIRVGNDAYKDGLTADDIEIKVTNPDGKVKNGMGIPNPAAPEIFFCWSMNSVGDYTVDIHKKATEPEPQEPVVADGIKVSAPAAVPGMAPIYGFYSGQNFGEIGQNPITSKTHVDFGKTIAVKLNNNDYVAKTTVKLGEKEFVAASAQTGWFYTLTVKDTDFTKDQEVAISIVTTVEGLDTTNAIAKVTAPEGTNVVVKYLDAPNFTTLLEVVDNKVEAKAGRYFALAITAPEGKEVDNVKANGFVADTFGSPFYCVATPVAGDYNIVVTLKDKAPATPIAEAVVTAPEGTNVVVKYIDAPNFQDLKDVTDNKVEAKAGRYFALQITTPEGQVVDTVTANEAPVDTFGSPYYCVPIATAGTYNIVITLKAAA